MKRAGRLIGLAVGVAAGAWTFSAAAEPNDGISFEVTAGAAEVDLMSIEYGRFLANQTGHGEALVTDDGRDSGARYDVRLSGLRLFGARFHLRGLTQDVSGSASDDFTLTLSDWVIVPSGVPDNPGDDLDMAFIGVTGSGPVETGRTVEQRETEFAVGFEFDHIFAGFAPRLEFGYRRGDIDQTVTVDRIVVLDPTFTDFTTNESSLQSDCAEFGAGMARTFALSRDWSVVAEADVGAAYCSHDLAGDFERALGAVVVETRAFRDESDDWSVRGGAGATLLWHIGDDVALGLRAYARGESAAPYVAYPRLEFDAAGVLQNSAGNISIETEARGAYGVGLTLHADFN